MSVSQAISNANAILPGTVVESGDDPRWQAVVEVGEYIESNPEEVWAFVDKWGAHEEEDLRDAIACVLLEHLLEYHFDLIFPRVESAVQERTFFADMFCRCWKFGQSELLHNAARFDELQRTCHQTTEAAEQSDEREPE